MSSTPASIIPYMIGTAGHVDHGKTSLVKNLTGFDTDRHPEEHRRGMSIDFGVAPFQLPSGRMLGLIDVPGHEDFIRNMVAGASSIDLLLLVIAADDSVMPQTVEHLRIAKVLGVSKLVVVLTKIDLVTAELQELAMVEAERLAEASGFQEVRMFPVSNTTREGLGELLSYLDSLEFPEKSSDQDFAFRVDVRAVFSVKGHGTVVTGVPKAGTLHIGDELELLPGGPRTSVRGIQTYRTESQETRAHISSALNIRDLPPEILHRGMTLAAPQSYEVVQHALALVQNNSAALELRKRSKLRFHSGTGAVDVSARLIDRESIPPGAQAFVHLRFEQPLVLSAGDRFLLRGNGLDASFGGGRILGVNTGRPKRMSEEYFERLVQGSEALEKSETFLSQLWVGERIVFSEEAILRLTRFPQAKARELLKQYSAAGVLRPIGMNARLFTGRKAELRDRLKKALSRYHFMNTHAWGMKPAYVTELLGIPVGAFDDLYRYLSEENDIQLKHGRLALASFEPQISARELDLRERVFDAIVKSGVNGIAKGNLLEAVKMSAGEQKTIFKLLLDENAIVIFDAHYISRERYDICRAKLIELCKSNTAVELALFREHTGTSRNTAALILDSFDAEGLTRRTDIGRVLQKTKN